MRVLTQFLMSSILVLLAAPLCVHTIPAQLAQARQLAAHGDAHLAISPANLSTVNLVQHDLCSARQNLTKALYESQFAKQSTDDDLAILYMAKGSLALAKRNFHAARGAFRASIDLWTRDYGPRFFMLGIGYALRAQVFEYRGDHAQAISDFQQALSLFSETPGRNVPAYLTVKFAYAKTLCKAGSKQEADNRQKEAKTAPADSRTHQCSSCNITAESFRRG